MTRLRVSLACLALVSAALTVGCERKVPLESHPATTAAKVAPKPAAAPAPAGAATGERILDTQTPDPAPVAKAETREELPSWVPTTGRLTVVQAPDLAENLGLVAPGTTRKSKARISVADLLADRGPVQTPSQVASGRDASGTWLASNGRVRSR